MFKSFKKGQAMVETAIMLPFVLFVILGAVGIFMMLYDVGAAHYSSFKAAQQASIHIMDNSGTSCQDRALQGLGAPLFFFTRNETYSITPCSEDPYWTGTHGGLVTASWDFDFSFFRLYNRHIHVESTDRFR